MSNNMFSIIKKCGFSPKLEILKFIALCIPFICFLISVFLFKLQTIFLGYGIGGLFLLTLLYWSRYSSLNRKNQIKLVDEFIDTFTYFGIYINNGSNVYQALIAITGFCDSLLKSKIEELIKDIDADKSVAPFVKFSLNFEDISIREVGLSIYQMVDEGGGSNYIKQYETLFNKLSDKRHQEDIDKKKEFLAKLSVLPLIGSGIVMIVLTVCMVQIMGGYFNGI